MDRMHRANERIPLSSLKAAAVVGALAVGMAACDDEEVTPPAGVLDVEVVAEGLTAPVMLREAPDGTGRLFVVDQAGMIRVVTADGSLLEEPFLDVTGSMVALNPGFDERGLLGLAFHPQYGANGRFYVYYSVPLSAGAPDGWDHTSRIAEFTVSATDPNVADATSERVLLEVDQPQFNHNAGTLAFGPDGHLYISLGDGGGADDAGTGHVEDWYEANAGGNGQDVTSNLLGSILRIDVDGGDPYAIPADNPFVGVDGRDEIYAYGFRNPYRFSFDQGTGALLVGDAGQELYEEVSVVQRGGNYGWNVKEGTSCFSTADPTTPLASCPSTGGLGEPLIDPVIEYRNAKQGTADGVGIVVVGGFVYRGDDVPDLSGEYIFGDYSQAFDQASGQVFAATPGTTAPWSFEELRFGEEGRALNEYVLGFGQDLDGEVYVLTSATGVPSGSTGTVYRLTLR